MEPSLRLFFALDVPEEIRHELDKFAVALEKPWRPVKPERMHITLAFMGEVPVDRLDEVSGVGVAAASACSSFEVNISDTACFPESGEPSVLYATVDGGAALADLAEFLRCRLGGLADQKKFKAHLTLARCRSGWARKVLRKFRGSWKVNRFFLIKSVPGEESPRYEVIREFALCAPAQ